MLPARRLLAAAFAALLLVPAAASAENAGALPEYEVGIGVRSINPGQDGTFHGGKIYLGGFGITGGQPAPIPDLGRYATGYLGDGLSVRAISIGDGKGSNFAIADIEVQGWFAATRDGHLGLIDMRRAVEEKTHGALKASNVVIQSDHTHSGPDMMGVWGGVPYAYREYVFNQTVDAIVEAYQTREKGNLFYGTANGRDLLNNQFDYDHANNSAMDSDVRVLQARGRNHKPFATLLNFSAHSTVLGSKNTLASGDWAQAANPQMEQRFGGKAITILGTLGRTQPRRDAPCGDDSKAEGALCKIDSYAKQVVDRAATALDNATPLTGDPVVKAASFLITDPSNSPVLLGLSYAGGGIGAPLNRAITPPWLAGNVMGTITASARIGDVLLSSGPGEMYPQIPLKVRELLPEAKGYMTAGLANDQLGYLIAPFEAYPEPIKTTFFDSSFANGDSIDQCVATQGGACDPATFTPTPDPIGNDNYAFNVSHTIGERVTCSLLRGAGELFAVDAEARYDRCAAFANDQVLPAGSDVTAAEATNDVPAIPESIPPAGR
ncbi:MAG: hypothetical protein JWM73_2612 [Solirubrobacterales bacterium]|nr:hypothetical protein [Solirubrobacterales bacterium]